MSNLPMEYHLFKMMVVEIISEVRKMSKEKAIEMYEKCPLIQPTIACACLFEIGEFDSERAKNLRECQNYLNVMSHF